MSAVISHHTTQYLEEVQKIAGMVDPAKIDRMIQLLLGVREGGGGLPMLGKDLAQLSLETVQMFDHDAQKAGFSLRRGSKVA